VIGRVRVSIDGRTFEMVCAVLICSKLGQRRKERCMFTRYFVAGGCYYCYYGELEPLLGATFVLRAVRSQGTYSPKIFFAHFRVS